MYWLLKTEPDEYSYDQLLAEKEGVWDGVRNFQARNFLQQMKVGDRALVYHSGDEKEIVGIAEITKEAFPDPSAEEGKWVAVGVKPVARVTRPLGLEEIRNTHGIAVMPLVSQPRLSVHPVTEDQWNAIMKYTKTVLA
jgi:predicted RNA-binding protein with PUA-like domain